ncbi:hypothetical protein [Streptomyces sp. TR06-5]|uniref:hypothetical protein n=1 Tax=unclassified Streptomyces TaxID=2593676 RepID=UPI00399F7853
MSTSKTPERHHPRGRRLTVASVATAVVLAGGGGAYWASNATEPAGSATRASDSGSEPPPLVLDTPGRSESGDGGNRGIAPGEPNPSGAVYEAEGKLPEGPGSAPVHRPDGNLTRAEVAAVAKVLRVPGDPVRQGDGWRVGGAPDGSGPLLTVGEAAGGASWSYVSRQQGRDDLCGKPGSDRPDAPSSPCDPLPGDGGPAPDQGDPVPAERAKQAVRPALAPLHLEHAALDASSTYGALRVVSAEPRAGGLPVRDWTSSFTVDSTGTLVRGHGHLGDLVKGAEYPVMSAQETLKALNKHRSGPPAPSCDDTPGQGGPAGGGELGGYPEADDVVRCVEPGTAEEGAQTVPVTDATFGLTTEYSEGRPVMVPAWTFLVRPLGGSDTYEVAFPAVEPEYLRTPEQGDGGDAPVRPGGDGAAPLSYTVDGRTLTVTFWGGVCDDYRAKAQDRGGKVAVTVESEKNGSEEPCIMMAKKQQVTVELDEPLNGRPVVDGQSGEELPRKK